MSAFLALRQYDTPILYIGVQRIACTDIEAAPKWTWKNDLSLRGNFGLHGKTILPSSHRHRNTYPRRWRRLPSCKCERCASGSGGASRRSAHGVGRTGMPRWASSRKPSMPSSGATISITGDPRTPSVSGGSIGAPANSGASGQVVQSPNARVAADVGER